MAGRYRSLTTCRLSEVISPAFVESHRSIKSGTTTELVEKGGRGSAKSSFLDLILQPRRAQNAIRAVVVLFCQRTGNRPCAAQYVGYGMKRFSHTASLHIINDVSGGSKPSRGYDSVPQPPKPGSNPSGTSKPPKPPPSSAKLPFIPPNIKSAKALAPRRFFAFAV